MASYTNKDPLPDALTFIRESRQHLLTISDWTQATDSPLSDEKKAEWATYRQALRDLTKSYTKEDSVNNIVWPIRPE
tara:strand:+ start:2171 stop:2401 length:231 start_codon:yes stop_codon:yes gene_type:complete